MIDGVDTSLIENGDNVFVDADSGTIELDGVLERHVVTCILRHKGDVLLLQRSNEVGSYRGRWAGVSGYIEEGESDLAAARREASEEVGLRLTKPSARTTPQSFRSGDTVWVVHPFLFDVPSRRISIDWEHDEHKWVNPTELRKYNTVPGLEAVVKGLLDGLIR
ncbi:MAG: NUDIX domain-containing protein [Methanobacteriota archaeon]|nr:MAG: NUDIX domain-containing protein [Euryarchaeota archaeon]